MSQDGDRMSTQVARVWIDGTYDVVATQYI